MRRDKRGPLVGIVSRDGKPDARWVRNPEPWLHGEVLAVKLSCGHTVYVSSITGATHLPCLKCYDEETLTMGYRS